jgi:hypothetical protein
MDSIFDLCVRLLVEIANFTGLTYEAVNVIIFVILLPIGLVALIARTVWLERRLAEKERARQITLPIVQIVFWSTVVVFVIALL